MEEAKGDSGNKLMEGGSFVNGFLQQAPPPMFGKSRRRLSFRTAKPTEKVSPDDYSPANKSVREPSAAGDTAMELDPSGGNPSTILSEKRKALFEPLTPATNGKRPSAESLLPPPDFESASYPRGWLIGKKRKLVNVDVVESMRRIAVQEMNRKDREIDGLNEQLEEDAKCLEHLQTQLLEERSKRAEVERQNNVLQNQIAMLMEMIQENEGDFNEDDDDGTNAP